MKNVGRDESYRLDYLTQKFEIGQVTRVYTHNEPADNNWQSCDLIIYDAVPFDFDEVGHNGPAKRWRVPVLQRDIGKCTGHPWTPRVGDTVLVGFYQNNRPMIFGTLPIQFMQPVCRSSIQPSTAQAGAYEDWTKDDYQNLYDWRFKLTQWLHVPRREITDSNGRRWNTTFDYNQVDPTGKLRPVCFNYFDKTRDFMAVWECKTGKAAPDCQECELNGDDTGKGPDCVCECTECSGDVPAMNAFLKILSTDYKGDCQGKCAADFPRRLKYHHPCGSLFCMDSNFPANSVFEACDKHRGRIWLQSKETTCSVGTQYPLGHLHFRAEANKDGTIYPDNPQEYGKFNLSLRSYDTLGAHLEMWGKNALKGRIDLANEEIGLVQDSNDHCGTPDAHVTIKQTDGIIQIHSLGADGEIYEVASKKVTIKACTGTYIEVNSDGTINIVAPTSVTVTTPTAHFTGDVQIDGFCTHTNCTCHTS
jgi:hypothetical protein